ncbi:MAG: twin-arginine translocation signal domain-containing protein [bacterium]|nr:twin-arginine translocation signal domain-containing protein [bacterium]
MNHAPFLTRRRFLHTTGAGVVLAGLAPAELLRADAGPLGDAHRKAMAESPLVYVSPLRSDGAESTCHGEVWFVADGDDLLVVTAKERWKAVAIEKGLSRARLWVGNHGVWTTSDGAFKKSPTFAAKARVDADAHAAALGKFGAKYPAEWAKWGPRFEKGLSDGSRVLLRYSPTGA